ncbi:MAG TPA: hypothetical protein VMF91_27680 [Bryobacteraceae bacterium]|nr:hypothetical protein [Bryobacteraceae bacterium]
MKRALLTELILWSGLVAFAAQQSGNMAGQVRQGWLADKDCASGRAQNDTFTGTNPECAKRCVSAGSPIVLIDPKNRKLFRIANPRAVVDHVGDQVQITGELETNTDTLRVLKLVVLSKGVAECLRPKPQK